MTGRGICAVFLFGVLFYSNRDGLNNEYLFFIVLFSTLLLFFVIYYFTRPLLPGDAFDEFRQRDFERRKAQGFPKPLFPARFDTPEATLEQQAERVRIGGW